MTSIYLSSDVNVIKDNDKRTFNGIANSGKPFLHNGKLTIVDFANISFHDNVPVLLEHDRSHRIGFGRLSVDNNQLIIHGSLLDNDLGRQVANDADNGFPFQMSAHVSPQNIEQLTSGQTAIINGQTIKAPITILKNCRILEVSFTPTGVDSNTHATVLSDDFNPQQEQLMTTEIDEIKAEIERIKADNAKKDEQIATLTTENEQLKADKAKTDVDSKLSKAGFKQDDKGVWVGISQNTYNVLLSQKAEDVEAVLNDFKPPKANAPDYFFTEQFSSKRDNNDSEDNLTALAKSRGKQGRFI